MLDDFLVTGETQVSQNKLSYEARKELSKAIKKAEKAVAEAEARISELENGIAVIEAKLATPEGASDASLYGEYSALKKELSLPHRRACFEIPESHRYRMWKCSSR